MMRVFVLIADPIYDHAGEVIESGYVVGVYEDRSYAEHMIERKANSWRRERDFSISDHDLE